LLVFDQSILGDQEGYVTADFTTGIGRDSWTLTAYVTNLTDERTDAYSFVACTIATCGARAYQGTNQPRTYGIKWGQKF
jgi:outer membrane receptor protein involved in Fe transport